MVQEIQTRAGLALILDKQRHVAVEGPLRGQLEADLRELTDAEQDSKYLRVEQALEPLRPHHRRSVQLPFPSGRRVGRKGRCHEVVGQEGGGRGLQGPSPEEDRGRQAPTRRSWHGGDPADQRRGRFARGRTAPACSRAARRGPDLCALGTAKEGQRIDDLSLEQDRHYVHHYSSPPYSVGETGFMRGSKRRDMGPGALAQQALEAVVPGPEEFPYTIRLVSETLESNGSSSMGSVCGSTMSMMDAGVPMKAPVSGIAMGLVKEGDDYVILTDIQGAEDHLGDMDFKVAGTEDGITALQMDIKITGVTQEIMRMPCSRRSGLARRSSPRWRRRLQSRGLSSQITLRASRRCRSIPSSSAW